MRRLLLAALLVTAPGGLRAAGVVHVHAAASLRDVLKEIHQSRAAGVNVIASFGGSNALARQIVEGAPGDVFFSADEQSMDVVEQAGLVVPGTRTALLSNALVVVAATDRDLAVTSAADLAQPAVTRVALADPASVPAGRYARAHLERAGAWEAVAPKVVPTENVRAALAAVESGNVDAAIVYETDARLSDRVRVVARVPADQVPPIRYVACVLASAQDHGQATAFLGFLKSETAAAIFRKHGFVVLPSP
jgi:molybdate transport system substrate-binding protein